jgi:CheY-like chemotaxis protein
MNILICEDNPIIAMDLGGMLEDMGHQICGTADTSVKAVQQCGRTKPDLVMVDLNLADGRTGLELVNTLADLCIPSVIVSGETHTLPETTWAKAVVSKPFDETLLVQALAAVEEDLQHHVAIDPPSEPDADLGKAGTLRGLLWPWHR